MPKENSEEPDHTAEDPNHTEFDSESIHADFGPRPLTSADTATTRFTSIPRMRNCSACGAVDPLEADFCSVCGYPVSPEAEISVIRTHQDRHEPQLAGRTELLGKYRLTSHLGTSAGVQTFSAIYVDDQGAQTPILVRAGAPSKIHSAEPPTDPGDDDAQISTIEISFDPSAMDPLDLEKSLLAQNSCPFLPRLIDDFDIDGIRVLVTTAVIGTPLLKAWSRPLFSETTKAAWLEQLRQALLAIHQRYLLFPSLQPSRLVVGPDGILRVRDLAGIVPLASTRIEPANVTLYTAPELIAGADHADFRSDAYTFGAVVCALFLRRELTSLDFDGPGRPASFAENLPDALPPLHRLLGKTFVNDPAQRFPTTAGRSADASGFQEIGEALGRCSRAIRVVRYDIAGWSSIGIQRSTNEDSYAIGHVRAGLGEFQRELALLVVADGMGGHASGEIASGLAVSTVTKFMGRNGISATSLLRQGKDHPLNDTLTVGELIREAISEANRRVRKAAAADPERAGMGCTLEVLVLVGPRVVIGHVGDSRVYHRAGHTLHQITDDQTVVNRLVEMGRLTQEEAALHPRRSELSQAVGAAPTIHPDRLKLSLSRGDWLLVCSDGLTAHLLDWEIDRVLDDSSNAESACRRLVNIANSRGGSDNCTLIAVRVY